VLARTNGSFHAEPYWCRDFLYEEERARGYDFVDDLASPGFFEHDLARGEACLVLSAEASTAETDGPAAGARHPVQADAPVAELVRTLRTRERARRGAGTPLERAAEAYLVQRGTGKSIIAGYPWFADWGRDTFLALRG